MDRRGNIVIGLMVVVLSMRRSNSARGGRGRRLHFIILVINAIREMHSMNVSQREIGRALQHAGVLKWEKMIIKHAVSYIHGLAQLERPQPKSGGGVVIHQECTFQASVIHGLIFNQPVLFGQVPIT
tara:strand:- start:470 stop:850 length:381 start_codon:yes stop_codon:yes gene_type:complete